MHGWAPEVIGAVGTPQTSPEEYLDVFFARSDPSLQAARRPSSACTPGTRTGTPLRTGPLARPSTTRFAMGHPLLRSATAGLRHQAPGLRGQRRQRPDDPSALLLPAGLPDPAGQREDLPQRRARVPVPAPRRVRRRRRSAFSAHLASPGRFACPGPAQSRSKGAGQQRSNLSSGLIDEHFLRLANPRKAPRIVRRTTIFIHAARPGRLDETAPNGGYPELVPVHAAPDQGRFCGV